MNQPPPIYRRPFERPRPLAKDKRQRDLSADDDWESYLVDRNGNAYEPYSLAWRYLGVYIDCDVDEMTNYDDDGGGDDGSGERKLGSGSGDDTCGRKVLWAAYHDPRYRGGSIGEYQYYDFDEEAYDSSTCKTRRCARMDCHEKRTHWKLIGVYKETDGLEDWAEQLFKHEGICLWDDDDTYEFMQTYRENWPSSCIQLSLQGDDGNTLYLNTKPEGEGNMTYGIYTDEYCVQESEYVTFFDYIQLYYYYYYYSDGSSAISQWNSTFQYWNEYMKQFKVCQPCRAHTKYPNYGDDDGGDSGEGDGRMRFLGEENDGEGDEEQWGYNCYDDAGYTNCNQCYKFETKTDMEEASVDDLMLAHQQGTILRIKVNGRVYGSGGYFTADTFPAVEVFVATFTVLFTGFLVFGGLYYAREYYLKRVGLPNSLKENFQVKSEDAVIT